MKHLFMVLNRLVICLFMFLLGENLSFGQQFRAAVCKVNITPDDSQHLLGYGARKSTAVHDSIYHRIVVMDDGTQKFILVSSDICLVSPSEYDKVAKKIEEKYNVPNNNFWWSTTHTHSAPELGPPGLAEAFLGERYTHQYDTNYTAITESKLYKAVEEAISKLEPARLAVGWGESNANINRRARDIHGNTNLGLNPDIPVDRKIGIIRLEKADHSNMAIIANYAMHGTVIGGECTLISGDGPGVVSDFVESKTGAIMLFINGAAGNVAPIYSTQPNAFRLKEFEALLGEKIIDANSKINGSISQIKMKTGDTIVKTARKDGLKWPGYLSNYTGKDQKGNDIVKLPIRFLNLNNDIAIWAAPLELFNEVAVEIRNKSPFEYTFFYGYTNGWLGYMLTDNEIPYGGYEPTVSPFKVGAQNDLIKSVIDYLKESKRKITGKQN